MTDREMMSSSPLAASSQSTFLVGCPRSGTTLLQSIIASHPAVVSPPETHFFRLVCPKKRVLRYAKIASRDARAALLRLADLLDVPISPPNSVLVKSYERLFFQAMDQYSVRNRKSHWVEKTPSHLHYIPQIEAVRPETKFVHVLRNGYDTIASLHHVTRAYPSKWGGARSLQECVERWISDVLWSCEYARGDNHLLVRLEQVLRYPRRSARAMCRFLNLPDASATMVEEAGVTAQRVIEKDEPWKGRNIEPISRNTISSFNRYLLPKDQEEVYRIVRLKLEEVERKRGKRVARFVYRLLQEPRSNSHCAVPV